MCPADNGCVPRIAVSRSALTGASVPGLADRLTRIAPAPAAPDLAAGRDPKRPLGVGHFGTKLPARDAELIRPAGLRVVYVVPAFPWPLTSGYLRHYHLIRELARLGHRVSLLTVTPAELTDQERAALAPFTERIVTVPSDRRSRSLRAKTSRRLRLVTGGEPAMVRLAAEAATLLRAVPHDVAVFSGIRTYPLFGALTGMPVVADICDAASSRVAGNLRHASATRAPLLVAELVESRIVERALVRRADHTLFASARDRAAILDGSRLDQATVLPNGVDLGYWRRPDGLGLGRREIVLSGAMNYPPNADAARYLIEAILPRVRSRVPDTQLTIVGRDPAASLVRIGRTAGVTVTGQVDDIRPYLERASAFAAPLRFGAGIQNKLLEALAMQLPVVASTNAAEGLVGEDGSVPPMTVTDDPERFSDALVRLLGDADRDPSPPLDGRAFVADHFDWSTSGEALSRILVEAVRTGTADLLG